MLQNRLKQIIPLLPGYSRSARVDAVKLSGGITNETYRVSLNETNYVVSIEGCGTEHLGIDRKAERQNIRVAHRHGITPAIVFSSGNVLVRRFVEGRVLRAGDLTQQPRQQQLVNILQRCHRIPPASVQGHFCVFDNVDHLISEAHRLGSSLPANTAWILDRKIRIRQALSRQPLKPVFCHNDFVPENIICTREEMVLIDWEYAGVGDPYFDLGMVAAYHQLDAYGERDLLGAYFGRVTDGSLARLRLMRMMSYLRDGAWSLVQGAVSRLDFDFAAYGKDRFERFKHSCEQPAFENRLHAAAVNTPAMVI